MTTSQIVMTVAIVLYLLVVMGIGVVYAKINSDAGDF